MERASSSRAGAAVVTGASSGIGLELARLLAAAGHDVVLVARRAEPLAALAGELHRQHGIVATPLPCDLADPAAPARLCAELEARGVVVEVLVNNAGVGSFGPFAESDWHTEREMLQVNVVALLELTRRLLPGMLARGRGRVLNVASTAAFQPGPLMAVYYATKACVLSFSEALANEVRGSGVSVTALCPGPTPTGFQAAAGMQPSILLRSPMRRDAASVARAGFEAMRRGRTLAIPGWLNRIGVLSVRLLPRRVATAAVRFVQERR